MKHRNKRIGLKSDLLTHLSLIDKKWFKANCNKISKRCKMGQRGKWRKWGQYLQRLTDNLQVKSRTMRLIIFPTFLDTHTLKWADLLAILIS